MQRRTPIAPALAGAALAVRTPAAARPTWEGLRRPPAMPHRVQLRVSPGRLQWVVPADLAVGRQLLHEDRLVRLRALWRVQVEGTPREMARVVDAGGLARDVEIVRDGAARAAAPPSSKGGAPGCLSPSRPASCP